MDGWKGGILNLEIDSRGSVHTGNIRRVYTVHNERQVVYAGALLCLEYDARRKARNN